MNLKLTKQEWCSTSSIYKILYVCSINVEINKKSGSVPPNLLKKKTKKKHVVKVQGSAVFMKEEASN